MDANLAAFERAFAADPKTVLLVLGDISPAEEPVHDYITDINERCALFGELQQLHQDLDTEMPNAATLGFFMVAPTSGIREHLVAIRNTPPAFRVQLLDHINLKAAAAMDSYIPTNRSSISQPWASQQLAAMSPRNAILGNEGETARSKLAALIAEERDGNACILSGMCDPVAAHIMGNKVPYLNALLQSFWGMDKALDWGRLYHSPAVTQSPANRLSLNRQLHYWFGKARFAFKPLSHTSTTITLQFHWLRRAKLSPSTIIEISGEAFLDSTGLRIPPKTWGACLAHRASGVPIRTGQTFVIRADNANDLPSFELLELQWNLLRVAAICGAAEVEDELDSDVGDD